MNLLTSFKPTPLQLKPYFFSFIKIITDATMSPFKFSLFIPGEIFFLRFRVFVLGQRNEKVKSKDWKYLRLKYDFMQIKN